MNVHLINLTGDTCYLYGRGDSEPEPYLTLPSRGQLKLTCVKPVHYPPILHQPGAIWVPVQSHAIYKDIDDTSDGWALWNSRPTAAFIVPQLVAQFIREHPIKVGLGMRVVVALPTESDSVVKDSAGVVKGVYGLEWYAGEGRPC